MIVESGHIKYAMSHPEVRELRKSNLPCHLLLAYYRCILSATRLVFFQIYSRYQRFITSKTFLIGSKTSRQNWSKKTYIVYSRTNFHQYRFIALRDTQNSILVLKYTDINWWSDIILTWFPLRSVNCIANT